MIPSIWRLGVLDPTRWRRLPDKVTIVDTMKLLGNTGYGKAVTNVDLHRDVRYFTEVGASSMINDRRFTQRVRDRDERGICDVRFVYTHGIFRPAVRQVAHTAVLLRLRRHTPGRTTVRVLRDGYGQGLFCLGRRFRRRSRDPGTARALFPTPCRMTPVRVLHRSRDRVLALSTDRLPVVWLRAVLRRRTKRGRPVCSKWGSAATDLLGYAARRTIALEQLWSLRTYWNEPGLRTSRRSALCSMKG